LKLRINENDLFAMEKNFTVRGFGSAAVHAGHVQDPNYAHQTPIYASSTYVFDTAEQGMRRFSGEEEGFVYSRYGNPTIAEAERKITALETFGLNMEAKGILHASGMAAISTLLLSTLRAGDKILTHYSLYSGTDNVMRTILPHFGIEAITMDLQDLNKVEDTIQHDRHIKLLYLETPANPTIQIVDIEELTGIAKRYNLHVACDNTFATPYLQQPFKYGVDYIIHSTTKFLNGHGTAIGGILVGNDVAKMKDSITKAHRILGGNANPFDAFLLTQGIKTLEIRMERHCSNAAEVAAYLEKHPAVASVNYEGLPSHPAYQIAQKQMRKPGAMLSFALKDGYNAGVECMNRLQFCTRAVSLGTVDTLLCHPASMTHFSVPQEQRKQYGITDGLIRMNVGIENLEDILTDLEQAIL
jgi:methionine-gamma-lyase